MKTTCQASRKDGQHCAQHVWRQASSNPGDSASLCFIRPRFHRKLAISAPRQSQAHCVVVVARQIRAGAPQVEGRSQPSAQLCTAQPVSGSCKTDFAGLPTVDSLPLQDDAIRALEAQLAGSKEAGQEFETELQRKLGISEARVTDLLEAQAKARRSTAAKAEHFAMAHAALTAELDSLKACCTPLPFVQLPGDCGPVTAWTTSRQSTT